MARKLQITGDGGITLPTACVDDEACSSQTGKEIRLTAQRHLMRAGTDFGFEASGTPTTKTFTIYRAKAAGTVRNFTAMLTLDGSSTSITFDLKKNGASILSAVVTLTHSSGDAVGVAGTISSAAYVAGDVFTVVMTVSSATGAQGPWADMEGDELVS
jgi:hypothetical protein